MLTFTDSYITLSGILQEIETVDKNINEYLKHTADKCADFINHLRQILMTHFFNHMDVMIFSVRRSEQFYTAVYGSLYEFRTL